MAASCSGGSMLAIITPGEVVLDASCVRPVQLPQVFETRRGLERLVGLHRPALAGAVVHDGHTGLQRMHGDRRVRLIQPVVRRQIQVDGPNLIGGAHEPELAAPGEVAEIDRAKPAIRHHEASGLMVVRVDLAFVALLV
jgi:hypothetical protein